MFTKKEDVKNIIIKYIVEDMQYDGCLYKFEDYDEFFDKFECLFPDFIDEINEAIEDEMHDVNAEILRDYYSNLL